jgi:hypothetical protein
MMELLELRRQSEQKLLTTYQYCEVNNPKAIKIKNLSLKKDVDIVIANFYDDVASIIHDKGDYRGVQIYNKNTQAIERPDYPFLSIKRINEKSAATNGRLKKMIRFLKNLKAESGRSIEIGSYYINALCYSIDINIYKSLAFYDLLPVLYEHIKKVCNNQRLAQQITSIDGKEHIFTTHPQKINILLSLLAEIEEVYVDSKRNLAK